MNTNGFTEGRGGVGRRGEEREGEGRAGHTDTSDAEVDEQ